MFKRYLAVFCLTAALAAGTAVTASADTSGSITMEKLRCLPV